MCHPLRSIQVRIHTPRYDMELLRQWNIYKQPTLREHYDNYTLLKDVLRHPRQKDVGQAPKLNHGRFLGTALGHIIYLQTCEKNAWRIFDLMELQDVL